MIQFVQRIAVNWGASPHKPALQTTAFNFWYFTHTAILCNCSIVGFNP